MEEMVHSATAERYHLANVPNDAQTANLIVLVKDVLEPARAEANQPFIITSGFRSAELNKKVGGAKNSYHLYGKAADIACISIKQAYVYARLLNKQEKCDLAIVERKRGNVWVHVQWSVNPRHQILSILK